MLDDFASAIIDTGEARIFLRHAGSGPPLLLLHGFPQTHLMWRDIAPVLARQFTVVCADLRGYGESSCPPSDPDHAPYSKRAFARDMVEVMRQLGFPSFMVAGHDRGGRVAYRMALDHPECVEKLAVLDIVPTSTVWDRADAAFAIGFWPWSMLAQAEPLPERMLAAAADAVVDDALTRWGSAPSTFPPEARAAYIAAIQAPGHAHAICEDYRAAAGIDRKHDEADRAQGRRIACPLLALWSSRGALEKWYADAGGALALWREWADDVRGQPLDAGHFFPEELPDQTTALLRDFFTER
jgi:haloacetate dehalogenase